MITDSPQTARPMWVRTLNGLSIAFAVPAVIACLAMMVNVIVDVTGRTLFDHPLTGTLDMVSHWWMLTMVFAALGYAQLRSEHVRATAVPELLPRSWQKAVEMVSIVMLGALAIGLAYYGWHEAIGSREIREAAPGTRSVPIWPFVFVIPFSCVALALQCVASLWMTLKESVPESEGSAELI